MPVAIVVAVAAELYDQRGGGEVDIDAIIAIAVTIVVLVVVVAITIAAVVAVTFAVVVSFAIGFAIAVSAVIASLASYSGRGWPTLYEWWLRLF